MIDKNKIADSFPDKYFQSNLGIEISLDDFKVFEEGIYSKSMDEKWHVFVIDNILYFARSWTKICIFKVFVNKTDEHAILERFYVNRDQKEYSNLDQEFDTKLLKQLIQRFLNREDIYIDPKLELEFIKKTIDKIDPNNDYTKSVGSTNVGFVKSIYIDYTSKSVKESEDIRFFFKMIRHKSDEESLISLFMQHRQNKTSMTLYFNKDATSLLGQINHKK